MSDVARKPFGGKSYGHIPHLPGSRMGPGDHHCHEGQARICLEKVRDKHDLIIVQEKVDGSNVGVGIVGGELVAVTRAGYRATTSPYDQHKLFDRWVRENATRFWDVLAEGERLCGEWLALAHGTRYKLPHEPFVAFDLIDTDGKRLPYARFANRVSGRFTTPALLNIGGPFSLKQVEAAIRTSWHGALDPVEGAVWRVEREGSVDFLAKWVRQDKADGCFLPEVSKQPEIWNWQP